MRSRKNRNVAAIARVVEGLTPPQLILATVEKVPSHGQTALIRIKGSATFEEADIPNNITIEPGQNIIAVRPENAKRWTILSAYSKTSTRGLSSQQTLSGRLAQPANVSVHGGYGLLLLTWETPPDYPLLSYQVEVADDPGTYASVTLYHVRGTVFVDSETPGTTKAYRVRCVNEAWKKSAWSAWVTATSEGIPVGFLADRPTVPGDSEEYFATDTNKLYIGLNGVWYEIGGGGSTVISGTFDPLAPPDTPSSCDDEFNDSSLDAKWSEYDPDSALTVSEAGAELTLDFANQAYRTNGIYQALPSGDFTITTRIRVDDDTGYTGDYMIGILLLEGTASDSDSCVVGIGRNASGYYGLILSVFSAYDTQLLHVLSTYNWSPGNDYFLRVRYDGDLYIDISTDGEVWHSVSLAQYQSYIPILAYMGLGVAGTPSGPDIQGDFDFFRYRNTFDEVTDPCYGSGTSLDHGDLSGLSDDDHPQYHNDTRGDARYYPQTDFVSVGGVGNAGKPVVISGTGKLDGSLVEADMTKAVYDTNDDGRVNLAVDSDTVDGQHASEFADAAHTHDFLDLDDTPSAYTGEGGKLVAVKADVSGLEFVSASQGGGVEDFLDLSDTPSAYTGEGGKLVAVKEDVSGLEFISAPQGGGDFLDLSDTPSAYTGQSEQIVAVNAGETGLEFRADIIKLAFTTATQQKGWVADKTGGTARAYIETEMVIRMPIRLHEVAVEVSGDCDVVVYFNDIDDNTVWTGNGTASSGGNQTVTISGGDTLISPGYYMFKYTQDPSLGPRADSGQQLLDAGWLWLGRTYNEGSLSNDGAAISITAHLPKMSL